MAISIAYNAVGDLRASASLGTGASATATADVDFSSVAEGRVHVDNTPGASVSSTRGLQVDCCQGYGASGTAEYETIPSVSVLLPSAVANTLESRTIYLPPGKWRVVIRNLDATNAVTVTLTTSTVSV